MKQRLIFLDIDGTLTEPGSNIPPASAQKAIKEARKRGHKIVLCTGRNYGMLSPLLKYGFDGLIGSAGGYIEYGGEVIYDCPMTPDQQKKAMSVFEKCGVFRTVEGMDSSYTDEGLKAFLRENSHTGGNSELLRWREQLESDLGIRPMKEYQGEPIYKIVFMCRDMKQLQEPRQVLEDEFSFCIQEADQYGMINGELINKKFNKGAAVNRLCDHLRFPLEQTVAFGDSMNDLEMLESAALGVCMGNGSEELKEIADIVCPTVSENGLYTAFQEIQLF